MLAAINNQKEVVTLLLQHGANKDHQDVSKRTAVQLAAVLGHREAALALDDKIGEPMTSAMHVNYSSNFHECRGFSMYFEVCSTNVPLVNHYCLPGDKENLM